MVYVLALFWILYALPVILGTPAFVIVQATFAVTALSILDQSAAESQAPSNL